MKLNKLNNLSKCWFLPKTDMNKLIFFPAQDAYSWIWICVGCLPGFIFYYFIFCSWFVNSSWITSYNAYLFETWLFCCFFFFSWSILILNWRVLRWVPGAQDVDVIPRVKLCPNVNYEGPAGLLHPPLSTQVITRVFPAVIRCCSSLSLAGLTAPDCRQKCSKPSL